MDWIRVEEGLPPRFQFVQMYDQARNIILVGFLDKDGSWISYNRSAQIVSHWMPVPNIPIDVGPALYKRAHRRASTAHAGQSYAGRPFIKHLEKVAARFEDVELRVIALLNGVLTDPTPYPLRDSEVSLNFGFPVLHAVQVLTRSFTDYEKYIQRVAVVPRARLVKIAELREDIRECKSLARTGAEAVSDEVKVAELPMYREALDYLEKAEKDGT
jgi:hypothetical protein